MKINIKLYLHLEENYLRTSRSVCEDLSECLSTAILGGEGSMIIHHLDMHWIKDYMSGLYTSKYMHNSVSVAKLRDMPTLINLLILESLLFYYNDSKSLLDIDISKKTKELVEKECFELYKIDIVFVEDILFRLDNILKHIVEYYADIDTSMLVDDVLLVGWYSPSNYTLGYIKRKELKTNEQDA